jgi:alpha-mannosidase
MARFPLKSNVPAVWLLCAAALLCGSLTVWAQRKRPPAPATPPAAEPAPAPPNGLEAMPDGGFPTQWLISTPFPADVDAGAWENFNRFNLEHLPERDWLAPFGGANSIKPQAGTQNAVAAIANTPAPNAANAPRRADVPETGAASGPVETPNTVNAIAWTPQNVSSPVLDFAALSQAKSAGAAYAAAYINVNAPQPWFIETDGFLGQIWLNGDKIYDGFSLTAQRVRLARFRAGQNLLLLRSDGVKGDPWRKNWGWAAGLRLWRARSLGPSLLVGALRPGEFWGNANGGLAETVNLAVANVSGVPASSVNVTLRPDEAAAESYKIENIGAGEVREAEVLLPFAPPPVPRRRRVLAVAETGKHRSEWENIWDANAPAPNGVIYYLEGFHVDPVYLHDQRDYARITLSNTNQYVNSLRADPRYGVYLSEIDYLKPYLDTHPEDLALVRQAIAEGRVGTGGTYNQFNELNIGGEAIVRNILYGRGYHEGVLGDKPRALPLWDVFGHAPQITQIARKSGFDGVVWSKKITGFPSFFYDYAPDGSRLLHRRLDYAYSFSGFGSGKNYSFDAMRRMTARKFEEARSLGSATDLRINAADFTPPWTNLAGRAERLNQNRPQIKVTGQAQTLYFDELRKEISAGAVKPPFSSRDKVFFHMGVGMARSDLKIGQRLTENMTLNAERFATLAYLRGAKYPDLALDKAWRQILFNSHHDAITGTPSDNAFLDLMRGYREAYELSQEALDDSLAFLAAQINTAPPEAAAANAETLPIVVFNPLSWPRTDTARAQVKFAKPTIGFDLRAADGTATPYEILSVTRDAEGKTTGAEISFVAADVPSLGYKTYYVQAGLNAPLPRLGEATTIENEFYRVTVDPRRGGALLSLYDKNAQREIIRQGGKNLGNEIAALNEELTKKNVIYPAWEFWTTGEKRFSTGAPAQVTNEQSGGAQRLVISGAIPKGPKFRQTIELRQGIRRVDFRTELQDYRGRDELFTVNFPLNLKNGALVTEDRFGSVTRNGSKGFLDFRSNTDKLSSGALVYPVYNWAEYGSSLNLRFQNGPQTVANIPLRPVALTLGRQAGAEAAAERIVAEFIKQGVSVTPFYADHDAARRNALTIEDNTLPRSLNDDLGYHSFRVALGTAKENSYTEKLLQANPTARAAFEARLRQDKFSYCLIYDKDTPAGWPAVPVLIIAGVDEREERKAVEKLLAPLAQNRARTMVLPAETLGDLQAAAANSFTPDYGVALINGGTPATSLERPDTLVLLLTHTALWPGVNLDWEFTPEHKTHVFTYALYPRAGDWRAAGAVKAGYEFNNPLITRQAQTHAGGLPAQHSFLGVNADNVILSALKAGGNPQAVFREAKDERPVIARFYESEGLPTKTALEAGANLNGAAETDLLERDVKALTPNGNKLELSLDGFGIHTYRLNFNALPSRSYQIGATAEMVQPVFSRYWAHNAGAAPIGNDPLKVTIRPVEQMGALTSFSYDDAYNQGGTTTAAARVFVANNYQDRAVSGTVYLEAAPGWRVVPDKFDYSLAAGASLAKDMVIVAFPVKKGDAWGRAAGLVKARAEHAGQTYQDVLEIGPPLKLEWRIERQGEQIYARVRNPHRQRIEGEMSFIGPPESWAGETANRLPPREQGFSLGPGEDTVLPLAKLADLRGAWAVARLAYNGYVQYQRADGRAMEMLKK